MALPRLYLRDITSSNGLFTGKMTYKYASIYSQVYLRLDLEIMIYRRDRIHVRTIYLGKPSSSDSLTAEITLTNTECEKIYNGLYDTSQGRLRYTLTGYEDNKYTVKAEVDNDAGYEMEEIRLSIPDDETTRPTASMLLSPINALKPPFNTLYINGKTKIGVSFSNINTKYGASIASCVARVNGVVLDGDASDYIFTSDEVIVTGTITDTRGYKSEYTQTIKMIPYTSPRLIPPPGEDNVTCVRCEANGMESDTGNYIKIRAAREYSKVVFNGEQKNFCEILCRYRREGDSDYTEWQTILSRDHSDGDVVTTGALFDGNIDSDRSYVVQIIALDDVGEGVPNRFDIETMHVYMHRAGSINALALGKLAETPNSVDIAEDLTLIVRGKVEFVRDEWVSLGVSSDVAVSTMHIGRAPNAGCYYRVCIGDNHVFVAFNCALNFSGIPVVVNRERLPFQYRPANDVRSLCVAQNGCVATVKVTANGDVYVEDIRDSAGNPPSSSTEWVDGYINYWI